jgi:hypothetical protein
MVCNCEIEATIRWESRCAVENVKDSPGQVQVENIQERQATVDHTREVRKEFRLLSLTKDQGLIESEGSEDTSKKKSSNRER